MKVIKKDGNLQEYDSQKILVAVTKSANRVNHELTAAEKKRIIDYVTQQVEWMNLDKIPVYMMHQVVETALDQVSPVIAKSYRDFRNYKNDFAAMMAEVYEESNRIQFLGDKENSNADSSLVSTKRTLIMNVLNKELYKKFFLYEDEIQAIKDGYIYIHDMSARRDTMNCCLFRLGEVLKGGFEMSNVWYNEPKTIDTAFDASGDVILMSASQQYGGFTIPEVDRILEPYAEKSYQKYLHTNLERGLSKEDAEKYAISDTIRDIEQGYQGWEYKFNTVASSRGDYPFITITFGLNTSIWGKIISKSILSVHAKGQGKKGQKKPVLFPKLVFLYDKSIHGPGMEAEDVFEEGIKCSAKTMYPDWLSLTGDGYVASMYKEYGKVISPMGCVDGEEVITYRYNGVLYVESFRRMWLRISSKVKDTGQRYAEDIHRIIDLRQQNVEIFDTKKGFVKVKYLIRNLQNNWCDVKLGNGRVLRTTTDHPFETNHGVVKAIDLTSNEFIEIQTSQYAEESININTDLAWLQGFMLCDGCYQNHSVFASIAATGEDDIEEALKEKFKNVFSVQLKTVFNNRDKKGTYKDIRMYANQKVSLSEMICYFEDIFGGIQKKYRHIPNEAFSYSKEGKYAFLAGMIDADGYINNDLKKHKYPTVQIGSTNKELAIQQMLLAQSLGMPAKIYFNHYNSEQKDKIRYRVEFFPNETLIEYIVCNKKKSKIYIESYCEAQTVSNVIQVKPLELCQYSYDVTTESEHFEVSGVYSHNCRAFLSPYWERGGQTKADENDTPVFEGRFNIGAISLHLPMILAKAKEEEKDFYEVLDFYLEMIRRIHCRTYEYLGKMKASCNPLAYCEGGFYGGHLDYNDRIESLLDSATASFGITALNELQRLYNGKSLVEDGAFALKVMEYINKKKDEFTKADHHLYAIYGTPAESLCYKQVLQFRKKYGIIEGVSDKGYVSNSFHCHVSEKISPIEKQDLEARFWNLFNGGKIQYVKYPISYNIEAVRTLVRRAMDMGFYEGVNLSLSYCNECGHEELNMDICPVCDSRNLTKIDRMNGYLSYSRVKGESRLNDGKMEEIHDRVSM